MTRNTIRAMVIMAIISIGGIIITQVYWFRRAFNTEEVQFNREVNTALYNVANQFFEINKAAIPANNPIKQLSTNYYVVMINNEIDANLLEYLLTTEFEKRNIEADFEYGIYDCTSDKMVYGNYVASNKTASKKTRESLPKWQNQNYYFGVQFPNKASIITDRMGVWIFSSIVLIVVIVFFGYSLFVILKQKRLSEIQKDFINNMTHEFKTPISTISLSTEVLKDPGIVRQPDRLLNYATIIESENMRMKTQVERVLQMASVDSDSMSLEKRSINIHELIVEAEEGFIVNLAEHGGKIKNDFRADNPHIKADRLLLSNVFYNLFDNAIKYCVTGPSIVVNTINENDKIVITIDDNGIGIPAEYHKKIFDRFYRIPTGNIHNVKGFGLGLNYSMLIIKSHEGSIEVSSREEAGSTFKLTFKNG